ncbi:hypothetical protein [Streptomyces sp. NPDC004546]|uniref:hypothetical protein n=1 Tax=Streptomyces sp. NPDC004546 TaxID=3154282 RepID=UPI0033BD82BF
MTTAVVSAAVTAALGGVIYGVLAPQTGHGGATSTAAASTTRPSGTGPTTPDDYTPVYRHRPLSLKNYNYNFDLRAGAVSGSETAWSVGTDAGGDGDGAFEIQPLTDVYVVPGKAVPTVGQCAAKATHHPRDDRLHFAQAPPGLDVDHGNYATTDDITHHRRRR